MYVGYRILLFSPFRFESVNLKQQKQKQKFKMVNFEKSATFKGARPGWVFKTGSLGVGYYNERQDTSSSSSSSSTSTTKTNPYTSNSNSNNNAPPPPDTSNLSVRQKRLHKLRLKMNAARKANHDEVKSEGFRLTDPNYRQRKRKAEENKRHEDWENSVKSKGLATDQHHMLTTAKRAEREEDALGRKRAKKAAFGWEAFNDETLLKGHEKRAAAAMKKKKRGQNQSGVASDNTNTSTGPSLLGDAPSSSAIDTMVSELDDREKVRSNWSKRKEVYGDEHINHINEYNRNYNNRINRAYDKYTVDIRQSLERGTG